MMRIAVFRCETRQPVGPAPVRSPKEGRPPAPDFWRERLPQPSERRLERTTGAPTTASTRVRRGCEVARPGSGGDGAQRAQCPHDHEAGDDRRGTRGLGDDGLDLGCCRRPRRSIQEQLSRSVHERDIGWGISPHSGGHRQLRVPRGWGAPSRHEVRGRLSRGIVREGLWRGAGGHHLWRECDHEPGHIHVLRYLHRGSPAPIVDLPSSRRHAPRQDRRVSAIRRPG
jgi:hypothetical protein